MGLVYAEIELSNPRRGDLEPLKLRALVDSVAVMLCVPGYIAEKLALESIDERGVVTADGRHQRVPYAGPLRVKFGDRQCFVGALVLGDEPLLGAVPMEDMDLVIHPARQMLTVNPESPEIPHHKVKST